jgi:glyoxylase-like metal-dependent hydrolase (beta-lactamase superfamily II)
MIAILAAALLAAAPPPDLPAAIADGVWEIPGSYPDGRQPDGNTIVFRGGTGLVVMDTGRHPAHYDAILAFAKAQALPVTAIVNSHWHLDHTSGNRFIKAVYPHVKLYTSTAVERMISDVFPKGVEKSRAALAAGQYPPDVTYDVQLDIDTRLSPDALKPDVPVTASGPQTIDGVTFDIHLAPNAATDGDVWVYDPKSRILAAGDLITLPVPFLDAACVKGWRAGLDDIIAQPFTAVIPGHGPVMSRADVVAYRDAFVAYTDCAHSQQDPKVCAAAWLHATTALRAPDATDDPRAEEMAEEYVGLLRDNGGNGQRCLAP